MDDTKPVETVEGAGGRFDATPVDADSNRLFARSEGAGAPFVFLHGFGGDSETWSGLAKGLAGRAFTIAYDLPGHGRSGDHPDRSPDDMAKSIAADLGRRGLDGIHLVGHSMGGAVAFLIARGQPERIKSLCLIAPGGFGPEINQRLLRRFANACEPEEMLIALEQMVGWSFRLPRKMAPMLAAGRRDPACRARLLEILDHLVDGDEQRRLPVGDLTKLPFPIRVIWGTQDRVLPTRQSHRLPGIVATHVFERVGHMAHLEIPDKVLKILKFELDRHR